MGHFGLAEVEVRDGYIVSAKDPAGSSWRAHRSPARVRSARLLTHLLVLVVSIVPLAVVGVSAKPGLAQAREAINVGAPVAQLNALTAGAQAAAEALAPPAPAVEAPPPAPVANPAVLHCPVTNPQLVQGYGPSLLRFEPSFAGYRNFHKGLDYSGSTGTPVLAAAGGTVASASFAGGFGLMVEVADALGRQELYAHLSRALVTRGESVAAGDLLGVIGSTGMSTGPHLHFEVHVDGHAVEPTPDC